MFTPQHDIYKTIEDLDVVAIASLEEGRRARVVGTIDPSGPLLVAPFAGRRCVMWHLTVWRYEWIVGRKGGGSWHRAEPPILRRADAAPFEIVDDSGRARVDMSGGVGDFMPPLESRSFERMEDGVSPLMRELLQWALAGGAPIHIEEGRLSADSRLTVVGTPIAEPDPRGGAADAFRGHVATRMVLTSPLVTDLPRLC